MSSRVVCASWSSPQGRHTEGAPICLVRRGRLLSCARRRRQRMNGERDRHNAAGTGAAPHPVLKKYYESESERRPFVSALFDNAAEHYDWVCGLGSVGSGRFYRRWVLLQSGLRVGMKLLDVA